MVWHPMKVRSNLTSYCSSYALRYSSRYNVPLAFTSLTLGVRLFVTVICYSNLLAVSYTFTVILFVTSDAMSLVIVILSQLVILAVAATLFIALAVMLFVTLAVTLTLPVIYIVMQFVTLTFTLLTTPVVRNYSVLQFFLIRKSKFSKV